VSSGPPPEVPDDVVSVGRIVPLTDAEGPGRRAALWVQGCSIRCPGCFNPHLWAARGGQLREVADLTDEVLAGAGAVEGVTLLGGEPFEQAAPLARLAEAVRAAGLSVMTFTGYELPRLRQWALARPDVAALLDATDLLADGPYLRDRPDTARPWVGSTNQGLHALTDRYADEIAHLSGQADRLEVRVGSDGTVSVNGWAEVGVLDELLADLGPRTDAISRR
jgi:anaerobic ribonucleoside-triphosphate reductase activating protein